MRNQFNNPIAASIQPCWLNQLAQQMVQILRHVWIQGATFLQEKAGNLKGCKTRLYLSTTIWEFQPPFLQNFQNGLPPIPSLPFWISIFEPQPSRILVWLPTTSNRVSFILTSSQKSTDCLHGLKLWLIWSHAVVTKVQRLKHPPLQSQFCKYFFD